MFLLAIKSAILALLAFGGAALAITQDPTAAYSAACAGLALASCVGWLAHIDALGSEVNHHKALYAFPFRRATPAEVIEQVVPPVPSLRTVSVFANGVAQPPIRLEETPPAINQELAAFIQLSIDELTPHKHHFLTVSRYKALGVSHARYQSMMALLGDAVKVQPGPAKIVNGHSLGELLTMVQRGDVR